MTEKALHGLGLACQMPFAPATFLHVYSVLSHVELLHLLYPLTSLCIAHAFILPGTLPTDISSFISTLQAQVKYFLLWNFSYFSGGHRGALPFNVTVLCMCARAHVCKCV